MFFDGIILAKSTAEINGNLINESLDALGRWLLNKAGSFVLALLFIIIGIKLSGLLLKGIKKSFDKSKIDVAVSGFLISAIRVLLYIMVFLSAAVILGIEVTSFVTVLGTASLAVGLALQGALSNLAGGVLILLLKPFKVGDYILENHSKTEGTVTSIDVFYTHLTTRDNKIVVIPNGLLTNNSLVNLTGCDERQIEIKISVAYKTDIKAVRALIEKILDTEEGIIPEEERMVFIDSFDDSGMTVGIRAWSRTAEYWTTTWSLREKIKEAFDANGIEIPYNKLEVSIDKGGKKKTRKEAKKYEG